MAAISITPSLLVGRQPTGLPCQPVATAPEAANLIRTGTRALVSSPTVAVQTLVELGMDGDEARASVAMATRLTEVEAEIPEVKALPRDADGDGIIYEGTPRERPAVVQATSALALAAMRQARSECDPDDPVEAVCVDASMATERILRSQGVDVYMHDGAWRDFSHAYVVEESTGRIFDPTLDQFYPDGRGNDFGDWADASWADGLPPYPRGWKPSDGPAIVEPDDPFAQHYMTHRVDGTNMAGDKPYWIEGQEPAWWPPSSPSPPVRSGNEQLDAAIEDFLDETMGDWTNDDSTMRALADAEVAHGLCAEVTEQFVAFAKSRGLDAYATDVTLDEIGYEPTGAPAGYVLNPDGEEVPGFYDSHTIASVYLPGDRFPYLIDFTASQYGYPEHPKVFQ